MSHPFAETTIEIDAPIERIWEAMTDLRVYGEWNPFIVSAQLEADTMEVGAWMRFDVRWANGGGATSRERITRLEPPAGNEGVTKKAMFAYEFGGPLARLGLVRTRRTQQLEQPPGGPTRYWTRIDFRGPFAWFVPVGKVQDGFERQARALKARAEG